MVNMQEAITTARRRRPFTILGALIALITLGAFIFLATQRSGGAPLVVSGGSGDVSVVVAKADIPARASIEQGSLQVTKMTSADAPPQHFSAVADLSGKTQYFALVVIKAGQPVLANELVSSPGDLSTAAPSFLPIPKGFVAMTIPTSEEQGVAGYIQPGDYIGIIAIVDKAGQTASKTIFNNVHVIRVGTAGDAQSHAASGSSAAKTTTATGSSLTIVMNQCDAEYLNWFLAKATLRYTLENYQDYNTGAANNPQQATACPIDKAAGVSSADVAKRYGPELVP